MRTSRLVATLLILQSKGRVTAAEVAEELEVSERTARRDLEALAMAGVPVYSRQGRGGGWELIGGARTDLSGLHAEEAAALFLAAGPSADLAPELRQALRKLLQALPEPFRADAEAAAGAMAVDPAGWGRRAPTERPACLSLLQRAVIDRRQVRLRYVDRQGNESERMVHPWGVVAKGPTWYLVAGTDRGRRTFRLDRVVEAVPTDQPAERPEDFDLEAAWAEIVAEVDGRRAPYAVRARAEDWVLPILRYLGATRLELGEVGADGRTEVTVSGYSAEALAGELAGFGQGLEVLDPPEVRAMLAAIGAELTALYGAGPSDG